MALLKTDPSDVIEIWTRNGSCTVELMSGDITKLPVNDKVDIVMISAYPGDYAPMSSTVIGALKNNLGINVMKMSNDKELDLRHNFCCWLSKPITSPNSPFKKLLCFERGRKDKASLLAQITEIFRIFAPVFNNQDHTVITPLLATGHQGQNRAVVCETMVKAALHWINAGLPLRCLKIVIYEGVSKEIRDKFNKLKTRFEAKNDKLKQRLLTKNYDVYVTFHISDVQYVHKIKYLLEQQKADMRIYVEKQKFDENKVWQDAIFTNMVTSKRIIAVLTEAYLGSGECLEEYNMAMCCNRLFGFEVLVPFYIETIDNLPSHMGLVQWLDCRVRKEGETTESKIKVACLTVIQALNEVHQTGDNASSNTGPTSLVRTEQSSDKFINDVFISYSHKHPVHAERLLSTFKKLDGNVKVFYDRSALTTGSNWQNMLYNSVGECKCMVALISESYLNSVVCNEEYNLALARYLCQDKGMKLICVCIEKFENLPAHIMASNVIHAVEDFDGITTHLAQSLILWLKNTSASWNGIGPSQEKVNIDKILAENRSGDIKNQYHINKLKKDVYSFERNIPLNIPKRDESVTFLDESKVDIVVSYCNDAVHLVGTFCSLLDKFYPGLNISAQTEMHHKRFIALDSAKKIVIFMSQEFMQSEQHMQELHVSLSLQRNNYENILYLVKTMELSGGPFFTRILPYNVCSVDCIWKDFEKQYKLGKDSEKKSVYAKQKRLGNATTFTCEFSEYFAIMKAAEDVLESVCKTKDERTVLCPMLLNVLEMATDTVKGAASSSTKDMSVGSGKENGLSTTKQGKDGKVEGKIEKDPTYVHGRVNNASNTTHNNCDKSVGQNDWTESDLNVNGALNFQTNNNSISLYHNVLDNSLHTRSNSFHSNFIQPCHTAKESKGTKMCFIL